MSTSVVYPVGIARALGHLNSAGNDIQIFVEDTANRNVWRKILKALLPDGVSFRDPIALGGRKQVVDECRRDQQNDGRKKLYIIDADFDLLHGKRKRNLRHLYRLRAYCIENYLFQEEALIRVAQIMDVNVTEQAARRKLNFSSWKRSNREKFEKLFVCYAAVNRIDSSHKTVRYWIGNLAKSGTDYGSLCPHKTNARVRELIRKIRADFSKEEFGEVYREISKRAQALDTWDYVSAKDGHLKQIITRMKQLFGQMREDQIKVLLAEFFEASVDPYLVRRLRKLCE